MSTRPSGRPGRSPSSSTAEPVKTVPQAPDYPMQLMLGVYEFPGEEPVEYPHVFHVEFVRGACLRSSPACR